MGDTSTASPPARGLLRFGIPDLSVAAEDRSLYGLPANKEVKVISQILHDARENPSLLPGAAGLDTQGFTYIKHQSALTETGPYCWYTDTNVEDIYLPEVTKLICDLTGAKRAVVNNVAFRRRVGAASNDPTFYYRRGDPFDVEVSQLPRDRLVVHGKDAARSSEPTRGAHVDYSLRGLRDTARHCRQDIVDAARDALAAEDNETPVPRYAAYSVWRPLRTVRRDPLAVLDVRSLDPAELVECTYRAVSGVTPTGEYLMGAAVLTPPKRPGDQKWYWMPHQKENEVLVIKFADTAAGELGGGGAEICDGCPHLSPVVPGTEEEEARCSIEARVLAFW